MHEVANNKDEQGALEDAQWQVRKLKQTCAVCHKHYGLKCTVLINRICPV